MRPAPLLPLAALARLLSLSGLCNSTPPAGRSISPRRHAGPIEPLWPVLEGPHFRISTAPVTLPGPTPFAGVVDGSSARLALNLDLQIAQVRSAYSDLVWDLPTLSTSPPRTC